MRRLIGSISVILCALLIAVAPAIANESPPDESVVTALSEFTSSECVEIADLTPASVIEQADFRTPWAERSRASTIEASHRFELAQLSTTPQHVVHLSLWRQSSKNTLAGFQQLS